MLALVPALVLIVSALLLPGEAQAEERKFIVMLAHSHKQVGTIGDPGIDVNDVHQAYFAEDQISFKRFWEEVSYGDVTIDGTTLPHGFLPWPLEAPDDVLDQSNDLYANGTIPYTDLDRSRSFSYGVGEPFQEFEQPFGIDWDGNFNAFRTFPGFKGQCHENRVPCPSQFKPPIFVQLRRHTAQCLAELSSCVKPVESGNQGLAVIKRG